MWALIVSVPDHCLSFYSETKARKMSLRKKKITLSLSCNRQRLCGSWSCQSVQNPKCGSAKISLWIKNISWPCSILQKVCQGVQQQLSPTLFLVADRCCLYLVNLFWKYQKPFEFSLSCISKLTKAIHFNCDATSTAIGYILGQKWVWERADNKSFWEELNVMMDTVIQGKKTSNDQEPTQSDPTSCPQNQKGNN